MTVRNPLSEFDARPTGKFREALSEADDFIRRADGYAESQVRVQELEAELAEIYALVDQATARTITDTDLYYELLMVKLHNEKEK